MAAALVITGLAGSMFFDLGNILQSNHSEVKFWRGDWVRKKTERHEKKIPFPDRRTNAAVETAMQQFFPLNFFEKKEEEKCAPADDQKRRKNQKNAALLSWTPCMFIAISIYLSSKLRLIQLCNPPVNENRLTNGFYGTFSHSTNKVPVCFIHRFWQSHNSGGKVALHCFCYCTHCCCIF